MMIDWGMIISAVLGLVGGGALTGFMLRKQRRAGTIGTSAMFA